MKFFTPERYLRLGNLQSKQAFLSAQEDWELAIANYKKHLHRINGELPTGLRRLMESVYLHDARILDVWMAPARRFTMTLRPESDPSRLVVLSYSLLKAPTIVKEVLPPAARSEPVSWLYDELGRRGTSFRHDILLSNGWELRLRFRHATVQRPVPLILGTPEAVPVAAS